LMPVGGKKTRDPIVAAAAMSCAGRQGEVPVCIEA
jgi:hypothetical protein